jgi:hypothetical protein
MELSTCVPGSRRTSLNGALNLVVRSILVLLIALGLFATEKYEIAKTADLVVTGQIRKTWSFPWFDGWHFFGSIYVDKVLFGPSSPGEELAYHFTCSCCPIWPRPALGLANKKGVWFLNRRNTGGWSASGSCSDGGYRDLLSLADYRSYFQSQKH